MEQLLINNANQVFPIIPAGPALRDVSGAANVSLSSSEAASDIILLSGVLTGNIVVTVPAPQVPAQVNGSTGSVGLGAGWIKIFRNNTTGAFTLSIQGPTGAPIVLPQGESQLIWSPDGQSAFPANTAI